MKTVRLKRGEDKRVRAGHPWIFSNEIQTSLRDHAPGDLVRVVGAGGNQLGIGYANPASLIAVRLLSSGRRELEPSFIDDRISRALKNRESLYPGSDVYRVVYGESDDLPGLIVDRYGPSVALQILTAGMERRRQEILDAVLSLLRPESVILRNDSRYRLLEGLEMEKEVMHGDWTGPIWVDFAGMRTLADVLDGQKTGLYLDQRDNLSAMHPVRENAAVLDCFSYGGAWGIKALMSGASTAIVVDSSARALENARANASANGVVGGLTGIQGDAFAVLDDLRAGPAFDMVIVDPPAFIQRKNRLAAGVRRYRELNMKAMALVKPGGFLISCSCSHHLGRNAFRQMLSEAAARSGRRAAIVESRGQARDHPILLSAVETEYLKCYVLRLG